MSAHVYRGPVNARAQRTQSKLGGGIVTLGRLEALLRGDADARDECEEEVGQTDRAR